MIKEISPKLKCFTPGIRIENAKDDYKVSVTADLEIDQNATEKLRNS